MTVRPSKTRGKPPAGPSIIAEYRLQKGVPDEMMDAAGNIRPGWAELMAAFDALGPVELAARFERADQYLRDAGVFYRKYDGAAGKERAWPLAGLTPTRGRRNSALRATSSGGNRPRLTRVLSP